MSRLSTMLLFPTCCPGWGSQTGKPTKFYSGINQPTNNSLIYLLFDCIQIFRHGFTVVFTAWRHAVGHVGERPNTHADGPEGCGRKSSVNISIFSTNIITIITSTAIIVTINVDIEEEGEMTCPNTDGGAHADRGHCIWQQMLCDSHQVGFGGF